MANWQSGAAFSNSFLNTIQALSAFENAQMQNDRLQQQMKREQEYETALKEESTAGRGIDVPTAIQKGVQFKDFTDESGNTVTAAQQRQALQDALSNPNLTAEERTSALKGYAGTEYAVPAAKGGIDLANMKAYQAAGGETRMNALGREATQSDVYNRVRQRMSESGNIYGQEQALRMGKLTREDELAVRKHDLMVSYAKDEDALKGYVENKNVAGMINHFGARIAAGTGQSVNLVTKPNGKQMVELVDSKGKVTQSFPADAKTLGKHIAALGEQDFMSQYARLDPDFALKKRGQDITERYYDRSLDIAERKLNVVNGTSGKFTLLNGGYKFNNKTGDIIRPDGKLVTDPEEFKYVEKLGAKPPEMKALGEGYFQLGNDTFMADPKNPGKLIKVEVPGGGPNKYEAAVTQPGASGAEQQRPGAAGSAIPVNVQGRPLYNESTADLTRMAKRPKGVSTAEAAEAQAELDARKGESRMSALR